MNNLETRISRRVLLAVAAAAAGPAAAQSRLKVAIFSKHLQFVAGDELAEAAAAIGFDAIDITVRKGGHVEPDRVRQDLPGLVAAIRRRGLETPMVTTDIADVETPRAEDILRAMADLGIRYYRWAGFRYDPAQPYPLQLERLKPRIAKLANLNSRYRVCAMYHTHSGRDLVGAPIWDLYLLLRDLDPNAVGVNYDVAHAMIEGGVGGWIDSFRIVNRYLRGIALKDFIWSKDAKGNWRPEWKPVGEGMVRFPEFFAMVKQAGFQGPLQVHFEYPMPSAREDIYKVMKRDLGQLRGYLREAGL